MTKPRIVLVTAAIALSLAASLPPAARLHAGRVARVTWYNQGSITASGRPVGPGVVACSEDIALGTRITLNGDLYICLDRGLLGDGSMYPWIDVYGGPWVAERYGDWAVLEVLQEHP